MSLKEPIDQLTSDLLLINRSVGTIPQKVALYMEILKLLDPYASQNPQCADFGFFNNLMSGNDALEVDSHRFHEEIYEGLVCNLTLMRRMTENDLKVYGMTTKVLENIAQRLKDYQNEESGYRTKLASKVNEAKKKQEQEEKLRTSIKINQAELAEIDDYIKNLRQGKVRGSYSHKDLINMGAYEKIREVLYLLLTNKFGRTDIHKTNDVINDIDQMLTEIKKEIPEIDDLKIQEGQMRKILKRLQIAISTETKPKPVPKRPGLPESFQKK